MEKPSITSVIDELENNLKSIKSHRYNSWRYCHNFFKSLKGKNLSPNDLELAQVHLAFYLASWGMYRGSSFLLEKDYKMFKEIVEIILNKDYSLLWDIDKNLDKEQELITKFKKIYKEIHTSLLNIKRTIKDHKDLSQKRIDSLTKEIISSILITKILMGTIGCIPAYDRFFISGIENSSISKGFKSERSCLELLNFYKSKQEEIDSLAIKYNYPPMKIIDMYFWQIAPKEKKLEK